MQRIISIFSTMALSLAMLIISVGPANAMTNATTMPSQLTNSYSVPSADVWLVAALESEDSFDGSPDNGIEKTVIKKKKRRRIASERFDRIFQENRDGKELNRKKKDGWLKDFSKNYQRATEKFQGS